MAKNNVFLHVSAGQGPLECCFFVAKLLSYILEECKEQGVNAKVVEKILGEKPNSFSSVVLLLEGDGAQLLAQRWQGTMQWIYKSPYRPKNYRKNWYVGIALMHPENAVSPCFDEKDVHFEYMRSQGPGGQHVNKTQSAVRAIHQPTGIVTIAKKERSQHLNKQAALNQLKEKLGELQAKKEDISKNHQWNNHITLERGNAKKVFTGENCQLLADKSAR